MIRLRRTPARTFPPAKARKPGRPTPDPIVALRACPRRDAAGTTAVPARGAGHLWRAATLNAANWDGESGPLRWRVAARSEARAAGPHRPAPFRARPSRPRRLSPTTAVPQQAQTRRQPAASPCPVTRFVGAVPILSFVTHSGGSSSKTFFQITAAARVATSPESAPMAASRPDHIRRLINGLSFIRSDSTR